MNVHSLEESQLCNMPGMLGRHGSMLQCHVLKPTCSRSIASYVTTMYTMQYSLAAINSSLNECEGLGFINFMLG